MATLTDYSFSAKCGCCKVIIQGESKTDREGAKKDFRGKMDQHLKESHNDWKRKVLVCKYCDEVIVVCSTKNYAHARTFVSKRSYEHTQEKHPEEIEKLVKKPPYEQLQNELKQLLAKYHSRIPEDEISAIVRGQV